jgi:hypothetical protein
VANVTPNLNACIIGPCYNVLAYVAGSTSSLIETTALSPVSAVGSMTAGSAILTLEEQSPFAVGDTVLVSGAAASGATLTAKVVEVSGYQVTLDTAASTDVSEATVTKTGFIANNQVQNTFILPGQKPGQEVEVDSIQVYLNDARIETLATQFTGASGLSQLTMAAAQSPAEATAGSDELLNVTNAYQFTVGDPVRVTGAGVAGADLITTITNITGTTVSLETDAGTSNASATITKLEISNINPNTSTLRVEPGDELEIQYESTSGDTVIFTSSVVSVIDLTEEIQTLNIADMLPSDLSATTTLAAPAAANATDITVDSVDGFSDGDQIIIEGAGAGGSDLYTTIGTVDAGNLEFTGLSNPIVTAVSSAKITRVASMIVRTRKLYNNQRLPEMIGAYQNYDTSATGTTGQIVINPQPRVAYGTVISGAVNIAYKALRKDLSGTVLEIANPDDIVGTLGDPTDENPLALGVQVAMANTTTQVCAIAVSSNDLLGYQDALDMAEGAELYALVPLTQDPAILALFKTHVEQMSTPEMASWRMAIVNHALPTSNNVGPYSETLVNSNGGNNTITQIAGNYVLTASNATFISDGVTPGDIVHITAGIGSPDPVGTAQVLQVLNNQQIAIQALGTATGVNYYITRSLTKAQQAQAVAAQSLTYRSRRIVNVMPDICGININGTVKNLPGYYLSCTVAGMIAGFPVQQGFTNISVAGISTLSHSNFYFTRAQMDTMAEAGTFLFVQQTQTSTPYVRHELTTDMSVLQYREIQQVKNIDFLSYYFVQILQGFIGTWNITPDSLNTLRQTITAGGSLLMGQKLPKIGPPLLSLQILRLEQNPDNRDNVDCELRAEIGVPMNYVNIFLTV